MKNNFVTAFVLVLLAAIVYASLLYPFYQEALSKMELIATLEERSGKWKELQNKIDDLTSKRASIPKERENEIENAVLDYSDDSIVVFLIALNIFVKDSNLPFETRYVIGNEIDQGDIVTIPISIEFPEISYTRLQRFVENVQRWDRSVLINSIVIGASSDEGKQRSGIVTGSINLHVQFSKKLNTNI